MNQYGLQSASATTSGPVDSLVYNYISGTSRLQSVTDAANSLTPALGVAGYLGDYHYKGVLLQPIAMMAMGT